MITSPNTQALGLVLAGGQSTRMGGQNKALIQLKGATLLDHACRNLQSQMGSVAISCGQHRYASDLPQLKDCASHGPLGGIFQGLKWAEATGKAWLVSYPVDTPFTPNNWVSRIAENPAAENSVSDQLGARYVTAYGRDHFAHALWPVSAAACVEQAIADRCFALKSMLTALGAKPVNLTNFTSPSAFTNVNTPEDVLLASKMRR